jgi:hypothetical protein
MEKRELGVLKLPKKFAEDPERKLADAWQAIRIGYQRVNQRFGKKAAKRWEATPSNSIICNTTEEFIERILSDDPEAPDSWKEEFTKNQYDQKRASLGRTMYPTRRVYLHLPVIANPAEMAKAAAHETIHAWAGRQPIKFQEIKPEMLNTDEEGLEFIANEANEAIVDFCALEALGLLRPPITRLEPVTFINSALNGLILRQMAEGFKPDTEDQLFRITQGKFTPEMISQLNRRMRMSPLNPNYGGFYEYGFLYPLASIHASKYGYLKSGAMQEILLENAIWTAMGLGKKNTKLEYLGRHDAVQAQEIVRQHLSNS